jgi:hypothetical protein
MKNQKVIFYLFKWIALIILSILTINENHSKVMLIMLISFVSILLIREGVIEFYTNKKQSDNTLQDEKN